MGEERKERSNQSVGCVVMREGKVLLVRHTYGAAKGKLLIPGGYVNRGETPEEAAVREVREETGIDAQVCGLAAMRFNLRDWYAVFLLKYQSGEPRSDQGENSQAFFVEMEKAVVMDDLTDLTRVLFQSLLENPYGTWGTMPFQSREVENSYSLYGTVKTSV